MDKRSIRQLNNPLFSEYCCRFDGDFVFECENKDINIVLGIDFTESVLGRDFFEFVKDSEVERLKKELNEQIESCNECELMVVTRGGRWVLNRGTVKIYNGVRYIHGVLVVISRFRNIFSSMQQKLNDYENKIIESNERASKDSLTMVSNAKTTRILCEEYLSNNICGYALMVIDVDGFKYINDNYGHYIGDKALIAIADIIKNLFRTNDIVGRIGGDEFLVLMKGVSTREIVEKRSSQIVSALRNVSIGDLKEGSLSCSVGVVFSKDCNRSYDVIFRMADKSMYEAKSNGGNRFEIKEL